MIKKMKTTHQNPSDPVKSKGRRKFIAYILTLKKKKKKALNQ